MLLPATLIALVLILATGGVALALIGGEGGATETDPPTQSPSLSPEPDSAPTEPAPEPAADAVFTIGAVGDVLPHDTVLRTARTADTYDFTEMLAATQEWSQGVDLAICNLEVPLVPPAAEPTGFPLFGAPVELAADLADLGWDGCSTGTNHSLDRGYDNVVHTLDVLDQAGLGHAGSARSAEEANAPQFYELERQGQQIQVAQIGATYGTNGLPIPDQAPWAVTLLDAQLLIEQAAAAREQGADLVVATLHWGAEYQDEPGIEQRELAQDLADSGQVDLIIGSHPHVPQPYELLEGGPDGEGMWVAYSLGNFISNQDEYCCVPQTATGLFMTATVVKPVDGPARVTGLEWTPMTVDREGGQRVHPLTPLVDGDHPEGLALSTEQIEQRQGLVQQVMGESSGAEFSERTEVPQPTGEPAVAVPRG